MKPTKKQARAYYLVKVVGNTQAEAGELMGGISRQAVGGLLKRFSRNCQRAEKIINSMLDKDLNRKIK